MLRIRQILIALVFVGILQTAGWASAEDGKVSGRVVVHARPLSNGKITIHLKNGQFVGSKIKEGEYAIDRVPQGTYSVTIEGDGVPVKFGREDKSELIIKVVEGKNTINFDLHPD